MENKTVQTRKKPTVKKVLTQGNKSLFTQYLKINSYNTITFVIAFITAFLHAFLRSNLSSRWSQGSINADLGLIVISFLFWVSMMLNVQRMVYGTRIDQIIFAVSATIGTVVGIEIFK